MKTIKHLPWVLALLWSSTASAEQVKITLKPNQSFRIEAERGASWDQFLSWELVDARDQNTVVREGKFAWQGMPSNHVRKAANIDLRHIDYPTILIINARHFAVRGLKADTGYRTSKVRESIPGPGVPGKIIQLIDYVDGGKHDDFDLRVWVLGA